MPCVNALMNVLMHWKYTLFMFLYIAVLSNGGDILKFAGKKSIVFTVESMCIYYPTV